MITTVVECVIMMSEHAIKCTLIMTLHAIKYVLMTRLLLVASLD